MKTLPPGTRVWYIFLKRLSLSWIWRMVSRLRNKKYFIDVKCDEFNPKHRAQKRGLLPDTFRTIFINNCSVGDNITKILLGP
jgi:hypothetical protein